MSSNVRIPIAVCAAVGEVLVGSHASLDALFQAAGAPGPPPELAHHSKWKRWLSQAGSDPNVDSLAVLGHVIEEFMDLPSESPDKSPGKDGIGEPIPSYSDQRKRLVDVLEEHGFRYFRGGRVLLNGQPSATPLPVQSATEPQKPTSVEELLEVLVKGLPRAIQPLAHRRKGATALSFGLEYDIQDLLHAQMRPWIADIRPEEFTPSYAGSSTRMDFLLPSHRLVIEVKRVRDRTHASKIADELIIDIEHYRRHPNADRLWCVVYDPEQLIQNPAGFVSDLEGDRTSPDGPISVRVFVIAS